MMPVESEKSEQRKANITILIMLVLLVGILVVTFVVIILSALKKPGNNVLNDEITMGAKYLCEKHDFRPHSQCDPDGPHHASGNF